MVQNNQFDTIYHEHHYYLSLTSIHDIFQMNGVSVFDVENISTHGGSLRIYGQLSNISKVPINNAVNKLKTQEEKEGIKTLEYYKGFQDKAEKVKFDLLNFLIKAKKKGKRVAAYGAAAKGNTMMNFAGIRQDLISYIVDINPAKIGKYMPGSRIPIYDELYLKMDNPDYIVILTWNIMDEITDQLNYHKSQGGSFIVYIPFLDIK